jgi:hypothetical protein
MNRMKAPYSYSHREERSPHPHRPSQSYMGHVASEVTWSGVRSFLAVMK